MGFGHRVYKNYDPRAKIIKWTRRAGIRSYGPQPKAGYRVWNWSESRWRMIISCKRKLYPNVDFYSGIMYQAMGFRPEMFTVLFAIPRTAGWLAQWQEMHHRSRAEDSAAAPGLHGTS